MDAINQAISCFPTLADFSRALSEKMGKTIVSQHVINWRERGSVPSDYALAIEELTGGRVTRKDLRPDDYWFWWPELTDAA